MNLLQNPELIERLATHYALGTLRGGARRRFESLAREHPAVRAAALLWQSRMVSMNELAPAIAPPAAVWTRIDNLLQGEKQAKAMQAMRQNAAQVNKGGRLHAWLSSLTLWRGATAVGVLATMLAVVNGVSLQHQLGNTEDKIAQLQAKLLATPQVEYVAVLADAKSGASMLVTFDAQSKKLSLQRVGSYQEASDRSLQLWALPPSGGPRSLGVLSNDKLLRLSATEADVREVPTLAISLEPKGGVPSAGGPTGPVLFTGALIRKMI